MKKCKTIVLCLLSLLGLAACGKEQEKETFFLKPDADTRSGYHLQELDLDKLGIETPGGICIYDNSIYICDVGNNCIVKLGMNFEREDSFGTLGLEEGNFSEPRDITFADGCFYVLDEGNCRVQKFTADFAFLEMYYMPRLSSQYSDEHVSIAVDGEGVIYVSVLSPDPVDAHIYAYRGDDWETIGEKAIGYLCAGEESIYFVNTLEMEVGEKVTSMQSGENMLYALDKEELSLMAQIEDKYAPTALTFWNGSLYMVSAANGYVNCFARESDRFQTLFALPREGYSLHMHMAIDEAGNFYIADCGNGCLYFASKL